MQRYGTTMGEGYAMVNRMLNIGAFEYVMFSLNKCYPNVMYFRNPACKNRFENYFAHIQKALFLPLNH